MSDEQAALLHKAAESVEAAKLLFEHGFFDFAASRAYYAMFYAASAILLRKNLSFSKHSAVHAAFGREVAQPRLVPVELHGWLLDAAKARITGDYRTSAPISSEQSATHIERAQRFLHEVNSVFERGPRM